MAIKKPIKRKAKPKGKNRSGAGRPTIKLSKDLVMSLAKIGCTLDEIAGVCRCSVSTLERNYDKVIKEGWEDMKCSLKRAQYQKAVVEGNPTMLIWLGKQYLGQRDNIGIGNIPDDEGFVLILPDNGRIRPEKDNGNGD